MPSYHAARSRGTPSQSTGGSMRNRPYSTSGGNASVRSSHHDMVDRRHPAAPSSRPAPAQRYVAYRPPQTPLAPRPYRPPAPPAWIDDGDDMHPAQGEKSSYFATYEQQDTAAQIVEEQSYHTTPSRQSTQADPEPTPEPSRQKTGQDFNEFLERAPPTKKRGFWARLFCGSPDEPAPTGRTATGASRGLVLAGGVQPRSTCPSQPSAAARRRARHAGDEEEPYRAKTGGDDAGRTYYAPRYDG